MYHLVELGRDPHGNPSSQSPIKFVGEDPICTVLHTWNEIYEGENHLIVRYLHPFRGILLLLRGGGYARNEGIRGDLVSEYFFEEEEDEENISEPPPRVGMKVVVKDVDGSPWEIELDPNYHSQFISEIESQIPEKSERGTIRYSLDYVPEKEFDEIMKSVGEMRENHE